MSTTSDSKHSQEMDTNSGETFEDVALIVEGKTIKANSGILAFSSPVFASLLRRTTATQGGKVSETERHINMRFPSPKYEFRSESSKAVQTRIGEPMMELDIPNYKYKDIKKTLSYLVDKNGKRPMSDETAWRILPIAVEYKVKVVKEKCSDTLLKSLTSLRESKKPGTIPVKDVLRYLACAEKYNFSKMKMFCIDECATNFQMTQRKEITEDKHVSEPTKVKILDKMCENMTSAYSDKLEQLKSDTDQRFEDISKKMKQHKEVTKNWKEDTKQEVDAILVEAKKAHMKLYEELKRQEIIDLVEERLKQLSYDVRNEEEQIDEQLQSLEQIKDQLQVAVDKLTDAGQSYVTSEEQLDEGLSRLLKTCDTAIQTFGRSLESSRMRLEEAVKGFESHITTRLRRCDLEQLETSLASNFDVQDAYDRLVAEHAAKQREMSDKEVDFEKIRIDYEKSKAELRKYTKKISRVNTWIKWARPVEGSEDKCLCFRHVSQRSARQ